MSITIIVHQAPHLSDEIIDVMESPDWAEVQDEDIEVPALTAPTKPLGKTRKLRMTIVFED